jgi:hypothetical protein
MHKCNNILMYIFNYNKHYTTLKIIVEKLIYFLEKSVYII